MTFWHFFLRVLPRRPFAALPALWWQVTGRRVRARNRLRAASADLSFTYAFWMDKVENPQDGEERPDGELSRLERRPDFTIILSVDQAAGDEDVLTTVRSLERQFYPDWRLSFVGHSSLPASVHRIAAAASVYQSWDAAIREAAGDFVVPVCAGDQLSAKALLRYAQALQAKPDANIVYGDQDSIDAAGNRHTPWFKPDWNPELYLAQDYLSDAAAVRTESARRAIAQEELNVGAPVYDLLLRVSQEASAVIAHAPHVTVHVGTGDRLDQQARVEVVSRRLSSSSAEVSPGPFGTVRVAWPLPAKCPLVSIVIPTRDKLDLLRPCIESLLKLTTYAPFEVLVADNDSVEERTHAYFSQISADPRIRVVHCPGAYNFSAINNLTVLESAGDYLCFLNNDTEVIDGQWLTEMMRQAVRAEVGAVGAKLLYGDRSIQHAGVIVGIGDAAGHAHRNLPDTQPGYFGQAHAAHFVTAVTGACLLVEKRKFLGVGGFDEEQLAIAYNDVDLCLKFERAGWRNVYVPHAVLIHHESKSRGKDHSPSQIDRYRRELKVFQERWNTKTYEDPLLNPNLDRSSETFVIRL